MKIGRYIWGNVNFKLDNDAGHVVTLDMQLGDGVSMHCEIYSLLLHCKTYQARQHMSTDRYFKDDIIYGLSLISYAISTYILNS